MLVPINLVPIGDGLLPDGGSGAFYAYKRTIDALGENGHSEKLEDARFLAMAVAAPDAIFKGLRRPNQYDSLCYSIRPERDPDDQEAGADFAVLPRYGVPFLAFVEVREMGYVVFDWEWRTEDPEEPGYPAGWRRDFSMRVYP